MFENDSLTALDSLGEFGLIERIKNSVKIYNSETILGIGDDAAVIDPKDQHMVVSTDMLVEGIHFDIQYTPLKHLGYKAVVVNLSDIAAMNAIPKQITVSLAISSKYTLEAIEELYVGINAACKNFQVDLIGGDTTTSPAGLVISVTALGYANKEEIIYRNTAAINDLICVSGDLGGAYAGLMILDREKRIFMENNQVQPELEGYDYVLECQLKPEPRLDIIRALKEAGIKPTSMIDISDGLSSELIHICKASGTGCRIMTDKLPIAQETLNVADELSLPHFTLALNGGEDYELLFTLSQNDYNKLMKVSDISVIGFITEATSGYQVVDSENNIAPLTAQGWNSFKK
jgi:thiamine-monophosphate kinase